MSSILVQSAFIIMSFITTTAFGADQINSSILQIVSTAVIRNESNPWTNHGNTKISGSGVIVDGKYILTNAHVVDNAKYIEIKKANDTRKYIASVRAIAHDADLAILSVDDHVFYDNTMVLTLADLPNLRDQVSVIGFPRGEESPSITQGVVSRIDLVASAHNSTPLLAIQIDAAVNGGNSGGPALVGNKIVGMAFQSMRNQQNTNYAISAPVIKRFLKDIEDGNYDGFPDVGIDVQIIKNAEMKKYYGLDQNIGGYLIRKVTSPDVKEALFVGDIITAVDGMPIDNDGKVQIRSDLKLYINYPVMMKQIGDNIQLTVLHNKTKRNISIKLNKAINDLRLVPTAHRKMDDSYFIYGGLVFTKLSRKLLVMYAGPDCQNWEMLPDIFIREIFSDVPTAEMQEIIVISDLLPDIVNTGYKITPPLIVESINGNKIRSLKDVISAIDDYKGDYQIIETPNMQIVFNSIKSKERTPYILKNYSIKSDRPSEL